MSKNNNPFDLSKLKNNKEKINNIIEDDNESVISVDITEKKSYKSTKKVYSIEEIKKKLEDYIPVETKLWSKLKRAEYVRYFKSKPNNPPFSIEEYKDVFSVGGFIITVKFIQNEDGTEKKYLVLSRNPPPSKNTWMIKFETIKKLYRRRNDVIKPEMTEFATKVRDYQQVSDENQNILQNQITKLKHETNSMKEEINDLRDQLIKHNTDLEDMVEFITSKKTKLN